MDSYNFNICCDFLELPFMKIENTLSLGEYNFYFNQCLRAKVMAHQVLILHLPEEKKTQKLKVKILIILILTNCIFINMGSFDSFHLH